MPHSGSNQYGDRHLQVLRHQQHLDDFLTFVGLNRSEETVDCYRAKLTPMARVWDAIPIEGWTKTLFERYIADGKAGKLPGQIAKWTPRTVQLLIISAKLFGEYLQSHGVPVQSFCVGCKKSVSSFPGGARAGARQSGSREEEDRWRSRKRVRPPRPRVLTA